MSALPQDVTVAHEPTLDRYAVQVDEKLAGFAQYRSEPGLLVFTHTEIDEQMSGRGLASTLIRSALDDARSRSLAVLPLCPFVRKFIVRHRDYADLVPADRHGEFGL